MSVQLRELWLLAMLSCLGSCSFATKKDIEALQQQLTEIQVQHNAALTALKGQLERERTIRELEVQKVASRAACDNEKVRNFLRECEEGSDVCSEQGLLNAFKFVSTQPSVPLYLRPHAGAKGIVATRRGQFLSTFDTKTWLPSTRLLVLVQPRKDTEDMHEEALKIGREVQRYLYTLFEDQKGFRILGPKILPCKMKSEEISRYIHNSELDLPVKGEPKSGESAVRLWIFKTDC